MLTFCTPSVLKEGQYHISGDQWDFIAESPAYVAVTRSSRSSKIGFSHVCCGGNFDFYMIYTDDSHGLMWLKALREKLISHINDIGKLEGKERDQKLRELLQKSFPVIKVKAMRPIVMAILKNIPQIDDHYLKVLVRDRELYSDTGKCQLSVLFKLDYVGHRY